MNSDLLFKVISLFKLHSLNHHYRTCFSQRCVPSSWCKMASFGHTHNVLIISNNRVAMIQKATIKYISQFTRITIQTRYGKHAHVCSSLESITKINREAKMIPNTDSLDADMYFVSSCVAIHICTIYHIESNLAWF